MIVAGGIEFCGSACRVFHNAKLDTHHRSETVVRAAVAGGV